MAITSKAEEFKLIPCEFVWGGLIDEYRQEFLDNGEECNVLWRLEDISAMDWHKEIIEDRSTLYFAFVVDGQIAGICRVTPKPKHEANGMLGYAIRPSMRGNHLGVALLCMVRNVCRKKGWLHITACVDERNANSIHTLECAGWKPTGRKFDWLPNPEKRTAMEFSS